MSEDCDMPPKPFSQHTLTDRLAYLSQKTDLTPAEITAALLGPSTSLTLAETLIEAPIGYFSLPLGLVKSLTVNGKAYSVPLATEETSVVAALNKMAAWVERSGTLTAETHGRAIIGQIQIPTLKDPEGFEKKVAAHKQAWIDLANAGPAATLVKRGGGGLDIMSRRIPRKKDSGTMGILHVHLDPCEAMGANQVTQVCEVLKPHIEDKLGEKAQLCILSNLTDTKITRATVTLENIDPELGAKIEEASHFAQCDPYRAVTHNKGLMNGIDGVLIATGNDWRAVEAGLHGYAATKEGAGYAPLTSWEMQGSNLVGTFEGPVCVGRVGGATRLHPTAQFSLKCLGNPSAKELAHLIAAVGLLQNLAALRALVSEGIIRGHMGLQIKNILHGLNATPTQKRSVKKHLIEILKAQKYISESDAKNALKRVSGEE